MYGYAWRKYACDGGAHHLSGTRSRAPRPVYLPTVPAGDDMHVDYVLTPVKRLFFYPFDVYEIKVLKSPRAA